MNAPLLVELFTEELPPKALKSLGLAFAEGILNGLVRAQLKTRDPGMQVFATPRRLGVLIPEVRAKAADRTEATRLMPVSVAYNAGKPSTALLKRLEKESGSLDALERRAEGGAEYVYLRRTLPGVALRDGLQSAIEDAIARLPIPRVMSYQLDDATTTVRFVRPVHGLVALHGKEIVPVTALGLDAGRTTHGHRFLGARDIALGQAGEYETRLREEGRVIASFEARRESIDAQLRKKAAELSCSLGDYEVLLDEVAALVEWPAVYVASFEREYLAVPQECLILTMRTNQKYFPLFDAKGKLTERFLVVSNMELADAANIVDGNRRVVRPRLADARFFYDTDRRHKLESRVRRLADVVYHNRLGSQLDRVQRIRKLAGFVAGKLGADPAAAERAAWLAKADLVTGMVGEFPELQGVMGRYYALHDGEPGDIADAIEQHYRPRFANDVLPEHNVAASVALADKLDALVGIFGIGLAPTGEKDPFALRRHALGALRILAEKQLPLDLLQLLELARSHFPREAVGDSVTADVHAFMLERLRGYLRERGFAIDEVEAVVSQSPARIDLVLPRLEAVRAFRRLPEAESLAAANKRIRNILKKADGVRPPPDMALLQEPAEKKLFSAVNALLPKVNSLVENEGYTDALKLLAGVRGEVDTFFDEVMVMTEDPLTRGNRLALLAQLEQLMNRVADISKLAA
ncbi:MAG TPA: glycine--tRNA ligase subunit beta [Burkholderiales bacterium]|nr:glycine--tRNA ligase subunit beta [Burkholderiales bacterium]